MITAAQLRAARALLGLDQRALAEASGLSLPTIQRMEASEGVIRGHVESLMKLICRARYGGRRIHQRRRDQRERRTRRATQGALMFWLLGVAATFAPSR